MYTKNLSAGDDVYLGDEGAPDTADLVHGGAGNDQISGGLDADILNGDDGDDLLNGGAGDDVLDGGAGDDTAVFSGAAGDYTWSGDKTSATITGPDGTDTLTGVEHLKFGATIIDLPAPAPVNTAPAVPTDGDSAANTISEGAVNGTVVAGLALAAIDPDTGQTLTWSLTDDADGRFAIDASTGVVTVADASLIDASVATSHQITVRASDGTANAETSFTIAVSNVAPTAPADVNAGANSVSEGAANGASVGITASASDAKSGAVTYSLSDDAGGRFVIDTTTGVVTVADATKLNFESAASHQIIIRAADSLGATSSQAFTIAVTNVSPDVPSDSDAAANTVAEGAANGTAVGLTVTATDVHGGPLAYSLLDDAGGRFKIDAATGVVMVADASKLNFEGAASHQITVQASDGAANASASFTIAVTNVAVAAPADTNAAANTISEAAVNGAVVSGLTVVAADPNGGVTYSLVDDAGGRFAINATTGVVTVADASKLDFDAASSHTISVRATDGSGTADASFTIDVVNAPPSAPTDADATVNSVSEDAANGTLVGITATAADIGLGSVSYTLSDDAGGRFAIDAATGVVTVADGSKLNFETAAAHQITVRATDGQGAFSSQTFTIAVSNVANDAPMDTDPTPNTISESAVNGAAVAGLAITTVDINGGPLTYSLLDDAGGRFTINAATGVVTVANANLLNFEAATSHQITVQAASGGAAANSTFTIAVTNAAPVISDTNGGANTVDESAANGTVVGGLTVSVQDPHGGAVTYSLSNNAGGRFAINTATGVITVANGALLDHDTQSSHTITIQASDGLLTSTQDFVITLVDKIDFFWTGTAAANTYTVSATDVQDWQLDAEAGNDIITGGAGDDVISGREGDDTLNGGAGNDTFRVLWTEGFDAYNGGAGYDVILAGAHNTDIGIRSLTAIEAISANGFTNVNVLGAAGNDTLDFTNVTLTGLGQILAGVGNDVITGSAGADTISGEAGNDTLNGGLGADKLNGGDGNDTLNGGDGDDVLSGNAGTDIMNGGAGDDVFIVGGVEGPDAFDGGAGYDIIKAAGHDTVIGMSAITGVEEISTGGFRNTTIVGSTGNDTLNFTGVLIGAGITIDGGAGVDTITGSAAADTIIGGAGNDVLSGGTGDDVFLIGTSAGTDAINGGAGYDTIKASADNAVLSFTSIVEVEEISNGGFANVTIQGTTGVDNWDFSALKIAAGVAISLGAGNDVITGTSGVDLIRGDAGIDTLNGLGGDDTLDGGTENDTLNGGDGNDTLIGGAGNDVLNGGAGDDVILIGVSAGTDSFDGGAGYDTVKAAADNTVFTFGGMTGIEAFSSGGFANVTIVGTTVVDNWDFTGVVIGAGITISGGAGNDVITGTATADVIRGDAGADTLNGGAGDDNLDGGTEADTINGGDGNDTIIGGAANDILSGGAGDDVFLIGVSSGSDSFDGGAGYDIIKATADNAVLGFTSIVGIEAFSSGGFANVMIGGSTGNDTMDFTGVQSTGGMIINAGAGNDTIIGTAGADILKGDVGNDTIYGNGGNDIIDGGTGLDNLYGGDGDDTFLVSTDYYSNTDNYDGGVGTDTVQATGDNVAIVIGSMNGIEIFSSGGFKGVVAGGTIGNDTLDFTGKILLGVIGSGLGGNDTLIGTATDDNLRGADGNDIVYGKGGNDLLYGDNGIDTLYGGDGNDILEGNADADTLYGEAGDDILMVNSGGGVDAYDGGVGFDELRATANGQTIQWSSIAGIEKISSNGFTGVTIAGQYVGVAFVVDFTSYQMDGISMIMGGVSSDIITGTKGDDRIAGLFGKDILNGGLGNDTFFYSSIVGEVQWYDTVDGGDGWDVLSAGVNNAVIQVGSMTDIEEITSGGFSGTSFVASEGNDTIDLRNVVITGTILSYHMNGGNDTFYGTAAGETINGGTGNDIIWAGDGDDIILIDTNNGVDQVHGGAGYDKIYFASGGGTVHIPFNFDGIEEVQGTNLVGIAEIHGAAADDNIDMRGIVLTNIAYINGEGGNDTIHGSYGNDAFMGEAGNDTIYGETGNDLFWFTGNGGTDSVDGGDGVDTLAAWNYNVIIAVSSMTSIEVITGHGNGNVGLAFTDGADNFDLTNIAVSEIAYIDLKAGDDIFVGSTGADRIVGNLGADIMTGGAGADIFDYNTAYEGNGDIITDFVSGVDKIDLSTIDAIPVGLGGGNEAYIWIGTGAFTHSQGQLRYSVTSEGVVFSGDANGDGVADFNVTLLGMTSLSASDFYL